jgi:pimeloyl-ACP methyl ester carboxylesterase
MLDHFLADDGEPIFLAVSGQGTPLVLLHGWTSSLHDWKPFLPAFEAHHQVFRWNARAHGGHALSTATVPTVARMARDLAQMLAHYDLREVTVIGHSMGALTLWQYLRDFDGDRLARAVIIDQSPKLVSDEDWHGGVYGDFSAERNRAFMAALAQDFPEGVLRLVADGMNTAAARRYAENDPSIEVMRGRLAKLAPQPLIDCWASLTTADYRDVLPTMTLPTLLVYGGASNFYTADTARYVRDHIPNAWLTVYNGEDHAPHLWQRERFVRDVLEFTGHSTEPHP